MVKRKLKFTNTRKTKYKKRKSINELKICVV